MLANESPKYGPAFSEMEKPDHKKLTGAASTEPASI